MFRRAGSTKYQDSPKPSYPTYASELDGQNVNIVHGMASELRHMVQELALVPFMEPQWFHMVCMLNNIALFARQEAAENSSLFKGEAATGTVWDTGDTTCAYLIEEGKLNVCLRLMGEYFVEMKDKEALARKVAAVSVAQGLDGTLVRRYLNVFEQSLGQILAFALQKPESLQILDLPLLVSYCSHVLEAVLEGSCVPMSRAGASSGAINQAASPSPSGLDTLTSLDARDSSGERSSGGHSQPSSPLGCSASISSRGGPADRCGSSNGAGSVSSSGSGSGRPPRLHHLSQGALVLSYLESLGRHLDALGEDTVMSEYRRQHIVPLLVGVLANRHQNYDDADIFEACKALGHACDSEVLVTHRDWFFADVVPELLSLKSGAIARLEALASGAVSHHASMSPMGGTMQHIVSSDSRAIKRTLQPLLDMINFYERGAAAVKQ